MDRFQRDALTTVYWHRLVSTEQLGRLHAPSAAPRTVRDKLARLRRSGLVERIVREHRPRVWSVTPAGAELVEAAGEVVPRPFRVSAKTVTMLLDHALDVVEVGTVFVEAARHSGHECGPLSWTPEVAHHLGGKSRTRNLVVSDAVLHYVLEDADTGHRSQRAFFVELDRATMPVARLADKLRNYLRYYDFVLTRPGPGAGRQAWRLRYPRFPRLLIVLSGAAEHVLDRRLVDLRAHVQALEPLRAAERRLDAWATTLPRLRAQGPFAEIALPLLSDESELRSVFA